MWASIPLVKNNASSAASVAPWLTRDRMPWIVFSGIAHLGLLIGVAYFSGLLGTPKSVDKVHEKQTLARQELAKKRHEKLQATVENMTQARQQMEASSRKRESEFLQHEKEQAHQRPKDVARQLEQARQSQERAVQSQENNLREIQAMKQKVMEAKPLSELNDIRNKITSKYDEIKNQQNLSQSQRQQAVDKLLSMGDAMQPLREDVERAIQSQKNALQVQEESGRNWDKINEQLKNVESWKQQRAEREKQRTRALADLENEKKKVEKTLQESELARSAMETARAILNQRQEELTRNSTPEIKKVEEAAQEEFRKRENEFNVAKVAADQKVGDFENRERTVRQEQDQKVQQAQDEFTRYQNESQRLIGELQQSQQRALDSQREALQAQNAAEQNYRQSVAQLKIETPSAPSSNVPSSYIPPKPIEQMNSKEMAEEAVKLEKEIASWASRMRAAELGMIQDIPFDRAFEAAKISIPERHLPTQNLDTPKTVEDAAKLDQSWADTMKQVSQMQSNVRTWQSMAQSLSQDNKFGSSAYLDWVKEKDQVDGSSQNLATAAGNGEARDLSAVMRKAQGLGNGGGEDPYGNKIRPGQDVDFQRTLADGAMQVPVINEKDVKAVPGRKIMSSARSAATASSAEWMFVDSWYVAGPFANPGRSNRDKRFPPEERVNLDDSYVGKNGQRISWQFIQSTKPMITPPQEANEAVYYAYTELWFEEAQDLWLAVGADDAAKIWIEEQLVYVSENRLKSWTIGEAKRRVHFKQGLNRILYRVENGPGYIAFSLVLSTKPGA